MICVLSFCETDRPMALHLAEHIECLGGVNAHDCILAYPANVRADDILSHLYKAFLEVRLVTYPPTLAGWPDGPNQAFQEVCQAIYARPDEQPWLWMEPDCVPTGPRWLDVIELEYRWNGKPILGRFEDTFNGNKKITGQHVNGVAVYPHDLFKTVPLIRTLTQATGEHRRSGACPPAFDVYIAHYTVKDCAESLSIQNYWKSHNFRETENGVECDFKNPYSASNIVDMEAALIHGAKDLTLLDIVQTRLTQSLTEPIPEIINTVA